MRLPKDEKMTSVQFVLHPRFLELLDAVAKKKGQARSYVIRKYCEIGMISEGIDINAPAEAEADFEPEPCDWSDWDLVTPSDLQPKPRPKARSYESPNLRYEDDEEY